jgi:hypothetical protein
MKCLLYDEKTKEDVLAVCSWDERSKMTKHKLVRIALVILETVIALIAIPKRSHHFQIRQVSYV